MRAQARPGVSYDPAQTAGFIALLQSAPSRTFIANLKTRMIEAKLAGQTVPATLTDGDDAPNCYICCPSTAFIDYGVEETRHFAKSPVLRGALTGLIRAARPLLRRSGLDHQVQVNNWLWSTNPVPALNRTDLDDLKDRMVTAHPDRALVLRSLNTIADAGTLEAARAAGFRLLPNRQAYLYSPRGPDIQETNNARWDRQLLAKTPYRHVGNSDFEATDYPACARLYGQLYLEKYTPLNPDYTASFIAALHQRGLIELMGLRDAEGRLVAATGLFESGTTLTQPIVGYDTALPQRHGLYRMLMSMSQTRARERGLFFNMSAGAAGFKRLRGARPAIEYMAVHVGHLPHRHRRAVALLEALLTRVGVPIMQRYGL